LAGATPSTTKSGYTFEANADTTVQVLDPTTGINLQSSFTISAAPTSFNHTGVRMFCAGDDGVLRKDDNAAGTQGVNDFTPWATNCTTAGTWFILQ
jgi:hypothetical protein